MTAWRDDRQRDHELGHPSLIDCDGMAMSGSETCARRWAPAVAASTGTSEDVEALARHIWTKFKGSPFLDISVRDSESIARTVLASDWLAAQKAAARAIAEDIAYQHAATIDGERGCCHDEDAFRAGGRVPEFDGDEFDPIPDDCPGKQTLDRHLAQIAREGRWPGSPRGRTTVAPSTPNTPPNKQPPTTQNKSSAQAPQQ